ncbi:hypothetical protein COY27_04155 [Candidatus Woesearchaeota archaeon CG_4_10_14_0_2_um_filter_33_13]|nr:MAG: hypothetical protein COY27_04155 [Candidatus Woesearchaeota archaeon CG_4_10_14_0_2_um_filter_33_13]
MAGNDIRKALEARLGKSPAGALGGGAGDRLRLGSDTPGAKTLPGGIEEELHQRAEARQEGANVQVYFVMDTTGSMASVISRVKESAGYIGRELLEADKGIEVCVLGVGDHCDRTELERAGVRMLGTYGQDNSFTRNTSALTGQVSGLINTHGGDEPEAYECLAADLSTRIMDAKKVAPTTKQVVIMFGDAMPHGTQSRSFSVGGYNYSFADDGCPNQKGPNQLVALATVADYTYMVGCGGTTGEEVFRQGTYEPTKVTGRSTFVRFDEAKTILPEAIVGMVQKVRGPETYQKFLDQLAGPTADKVRLMLTGGSQ